MDDLKFYVTHDYCPNCNAVTTQNVFELTEQHTRDAPQAAVKTEHTCEGCESR
ncbi:hypothetical protein [Vibrio methylphosphonaticus]|uniref:hypothetical protein n=1 Tax=Vibrio methylphosphonaticus TaxID=2946866 RepID=UPI00202A07AF|nr:hypothetical protein [Vibrio methylphosphonaticus]MCL9774161.1 hypothetical protein [Vibrio methylphosphonaticus]